MKITALIILLACCPASARDRMVAVRLYSLHSISSVDLEPEGGAVFAGERALKAAARVSAKGSSIISQGSLKYGPAKTLRVSAMGKGVWLSGRGLPRRLYTGEIIFSAERGLLKIINTVQLETYLAGVVTGEAQDLSNPETYKAQAVAARTYTLNHMKNHSGQGYNLCDSTHCQLYSGLGTVSAKARAACDSTRGEMLLYQGKPAATYYHSICGGRTEALTYVWPFENKPYLVSVQDGPAGKPYCSIAPNFRWKTQIYYTGLTRLARSAGWITPDEEARGLRVAAWAPSGRAAELEMNTGARRVRISATDFYHGVGRRAGWQAVRSSFFKILSAKDYVILDGIGGGHGVGMCQWGAEGMGRAGFKYREILRHYYPGTETGYD